jgi:hypothetical protein
VFVCLCVCMCVFVCVCVCLFVVCKRACVDAPDILLYTRAPAAMVQHGERNAIQQAQTTRAPPFPWSQTLDTHDDAGSPERRRTCAVLGLALRPVPTLLRRPASRAASFTRLARSAPVNPVVIAAMDDGVTSGDSGSPRRWRCTCDR